MTTDAALAQRLAHDAGHLLLTVRSDAAIPDAELGQAGDQKSAGFLLDELQRERPSDAVLMEDARDDAVRANADRVWIIDPLDGTREFAERGRSDWAVHVALWCEGAVTAAAVALPARGDVLSTAQPPAAPPAVHGGSSGPRIVVSRSRPAPFIDALAGSLDAEVVPLGSAGFKTAAVILGDADAYVHAGGQFEWDTAAPAGVALAAGLHVSRIDGSALRYNQPNPWLPDILVCKPALAPALLARIAALRSD